jgi:hypothetical protein
MSRQEVAAALEAAGPCGRITVSTADLLTGNVPVAAIAAGRVTVLTAEEMADAAPVGRVDAEDTGEMRPAKLRELQSKAAILSAAIKALEEAGVE